MGILSSFKSLPKPGAPPMRVHGVYGLGVAYAAVALHRQHPGRPVIILTPDEDGAEELVRDLRFLCGSDELTSNARVRRFPADERGPYAEQSPDSEATLERTATLFPEPRDNFRIFSSWEQQRPCGGPSPSRRSSVTRSCWCRENTLDGTR